MFKRNEYCLPSGVCLFASANAVCDESEATNENSRVSLEEKQSASAMSDDFRIPEL